jgi:hypothetical protein
MAITYPLALPAAPIFNAVRFTARPVVSISESPFTLQSQVQEYAGQRLEVEATLPPMTRAQAEYWNAFMLKLNGLRGTFLLGDPGGKKPRGIATGTPVVNGASQTGNELLTTGWTISTTGILLAGDYIQIGTGSYARLHKVLDDVNSNGSGQATLLLWPSLRSSPSNGAAIITSNTVGVFRLASNEMTWNIGEAMNYGVTLAAREVV